MRILHCFKVYRPDHDGGIEEAISRIVTAAPADQQNSILVCRMQGPGSTIVVGGCEVERTRTLFRISSLPVSPSYIYRLRRRLRDVDILALHAPFPLSDIGILGALREDQGLVIHWHADIVGRDFLRPIVDSVVGRSIKRADRILVTDEVMTYTTPHLIAAAERCSVVPYGVDTTWWSNLALDDSRIIQELRSRYPRLVVACGRLVPYKGFDVLLEAMRAVDAHLIVIGTGPRLTHLRVQAERSGIASQVTFAGFVSREEQRRILNAGRVFVLPSISSAEAFGIAQLEAMCCGLAVVNTSLPTSVPTVARHEREALTVAPGDAKALSMAINQLLDDPVKAERLGRAGKARSQELFDWRTYGKSCADIYRQVFAERRRYSR